MKEVINKIHELRRYIVDCQYDTLLINMTFKPDGIVCRINCNRLYPESVQIATKTYEEMKSKLMDFYSVTLAGLVDSAEQRLKDADETIRIFKKS
jgi:hypothetical protein